jgi:transmembrane 9 superfamily protein 3
MLFVLLGLLVFVLSSRLLVRDSNRNVQDAVFEGFDIDTSSEKGWKVLHGDVFRPPRSLALWSILAGAGIHCFVCLLVYAALSTIDTRYERDRGVAYAIISFVSTAPIAGFFAVVIGRAFNYQKWLRLALGSVWLAPLVALLVYIPTSILGSSVGSARSFGFAPIVILTLIQTIAVLPLSIFGGLVAVKLKIFEGPKCDVGLVPRYISQHPWYLKQPVLGLAVGGICFISVMIELYYIFTALWHYAGLYVWAYFAFGVVVLCAVAGCTTVLAIYWLLQNEVHFWQWPAFASPAWTGVFVFGYSIYFLITKTRIHGLFQTVYYLLYMGEFSILVGLIAGASGLFAANVFVHKIFADLKLD